MTLGGKLTHRLRWVRDRFPLTFLGLFVAGGSAWALFYFGLARIDLLLLVVGIVGLVLVTWCMLLVCGTSLFAYRKLEGLSTETPLKLECGYAKRTGFEIRIPWFIPFVQVGFRWLSPGVYLEQKRQGSRQVEEVTALKRAHRDNIERKVEIRDTFGLAKIAFRMTEKRAVRFVPSMGNLRQVQVIQSMSAGDQISHPDGPPEGERIDIRRYTEGDPMRFVLWKAFAKSREIVVRTPERAIGPVQQTVAYLVTGERDEPAAGAARVAVECGALSADWVLGADGPVDYATNVTAAMELLSKSGENDPEVGGTGLRDFLISAIPGSMGRALVFVPSVEGPWLDRVLQSVASRGGGSTVEFVVCTDGVQTTKDTSRFGKFAYRRLPKFDAKRGIGSTDDVELDKVVSRLSASRARVIVLDRVAGRVYSSAHQKIFRRNQKPEVNATFSRAAGGTT